MGPGCFLSSPSNLNLPNENESENWLQIFGLKCPLPITNVVVVVVFFFFFFFFNLCHCFF